MKTSGLTKSTALYTTGNLFVRSANFLLLPLYSNLISPSEFGNYALLMAFYSAAMVLYNGGYQAALSKFYLKESDDQKRKVIFSTIMQTAVVTAFLLSALTFFLSPHISLMIFNTDSSTYLVVLIAAAMFFETTGTQFINFLITNERASRVVLVLAASAVVNVLLNIFLVYYVRLGVEGIILAQVFSAVTVILVLLPVILKETVLSFNKGLIKPFFLFIFPLMAGGLMSVGVDVADRFILNHFLGKADVGIYSFSYRIAMIMNLFVISFRTAWMPYSLKHYYNDNYRDVYGGTLLKYIAAAGLIFIIVSLFSNDLFTVRIYGFNIFEQNYAGGIFIIPFILGAYFLSGIGSFYSVYPYAFDKTYHFLITDGLAFLLNILLNIILIPVYGLLGAAVATLVSYAAGVTYLMMVSEKYIKIIYPSGRIITVILLIMAITISGIIAGNIFLDLFLVVAYTAILLQVLKIKPFELFRQGRTQ